MPKTISSLFGPPSEETYEDPKLSLGLNEEDEEFNEGYAPKLGSLFAPKAQPRQNFVKQDLPAILTPPEVNEDLRPDGLAIGKASMLRADRAARADEEAYSVYEDMDGMTTPAPDAQQHGTADGSPLSQSLFELFPDDTYQPDNNIMDPSQDTGEADPDPMVWNPTKERFWRGAANTLFSDEMGLLGIKWDEEGYEQNFDNFRNQLIEHPYSTAFTVASYLVPVGFAWMKGARLAQHAARLAGDTGDVAAATAKGLFGTKGGAAVAKTLSEGGMDSTWEAMKMLGPRVRFDDHAKLVRTLSDDTTEFGRNLLNGENAAKLSTMTDEAVSKIITPRDLRRRLMSDMHQSRQIKLKHLASKGLLDNSPYLKKEEQFFRAFGNEYWKQLDNSSVERIQNAHRWMDEQNTAKLLSTIPNITPKMSQTAYKFFAGKVDSDQLIKEVGPEAAQWIDGLKQQWTGLFEAQVDEGYMGARQVELYGRHLGEIGSDGVARAERFAGSGELGGHHLPAIKKGTPGFTDAGAHTTTLKGKIKDGEAIIDEKRVFDPAKALSGPTSKNLEKYTDWATREADLDNLITDLGELTVGGFIKDDTMFMMHRVFRDTVVENITKGANNMDTHFLGMTNFEKLSPYAKKHWLSMDELDSVSPGLKEKLTRMVKKKMQKDGTDADWDGSMPAISRDYVEQFFGAGDEGAQMASTTFGRLFQLLTAVHKTAKTALNPATHVNNLVGNMAFIGMSGVNPFSRQMLDDGKTFSGLFAKLAKQSRATPGMEMDDLLNKENIAKVFGDDATRYVTDAFGTKVDLAEVFSDPAVRQMMEAQAFESAEGFARAQKTLVQLERYEADGFSDKVAAQIGRTVGGFGEAPGVKNVLQHASSAYLAEDMIPKMMLLNHYIRKGWSSQSALQEVGRRLPQYMTVGRTTKAARRHVMPWLTFQTEAARIMKNNMQDYPVSTIAWLHAPKIAQEALNATGYAPTPEEQGAMVPGTPAWASKYSSVYLKEGTAQPILGGAGGLSVGMAAGAKLGGAKGALLMGLLGTAGGAALGMQSPYAQRTQEENAGLARSWALDFLPQSALSWASGHPTEWEALDPISLQHSEDVTDGSGINMFGINVNLSDSPFTGMETMNKLSNVNPVSIGSILSPLIQIATNRSSFGQELPTEGLIGPGSVANKGAAGLMAFLMPPAIQKWGFSLDKVPNEDTFEANGSQSTLPTGTVPTLFGLAASGLTFLGGKKMQAAKKAAGTTSSLVKQTMDASGKFFTSKAGKKVLASQIRNPALGAGAFAATAGTEFNYSRFLRDIGLENDPTTGTKSGDWTADAVMNTLFGTSKSWAVNDGVAAKAEKNRARAFSEGRKTATKQFKAAFRNQSESAMLANAGAAYKSFMMEFAGDRKKSLLKFNTWLESNFKSAARDSNFSGISVEEIRRRSMVNFDVMLEDGSAFHKRKQHRLNNELRTRDIQNTRNVKVNKYE